MEYSDLKTQGLATDLIHAKRNFQVFKKIKEIWDHIHILEPHEQKLFDYIKNRAKEAVVIHLAKIYDHHDKRYPTRCVESIFKYINEQESPYLRKEFSELQWDKFVKYNSLTFNWLDDSNVDYSTFIDTVKNKLTKEKKDNNSSLNVLQTWRNKEIAHNESHDIPIHLKIDEVEVLMAVPETILNFLNQFVRIPESQMVMIRRPDTKFIDEMIKKYIPNS